ncbi:uncharacterized protein LOC127855769 [Dreissena polymorpha]|uniref:Uncharacterized protein n=1 Tax=Dreissena polymorpha TaxID=45954 RepID=A0A9D4C2I4_DREPO|nr:uncharacterized protein LOC127855769 [Dreissena polymorpha]KAH3715903.1 hypothetical protein DPMN_058618 [Dreissena polymorpha]
MQTQTVILAAILACCLLAANSLGMPTQPDENGNPLSADKRPKYMETRDLSYFKELLLVALDELIDDGIINTSVLNKPESKEPEVPTKRGERLGLCFRRNQSGAFHARPCWKESGRR